MNHYTLAAPPTKRLSLLLRIKRYSLSLVCPVYLSIPYHLFEFICSFRTFFSLLLYFAYRHWSINSDDPDQTPHSVASNQGQSTLFTNVPKTVFLSQDLTVQIEIRTLLLSSSLLDNVGLCFCQISLLEIIGTSSSPFGTF